jgi:hypothetical protein
MPFHLSDVQHVYYSAMEDQPAEEDTDAPTAVDNINNYLQSPTMKI